MRVRLSGAFVTRFYEEWQRIGDTMLTEGVYHGPTCGEKHQRVERFLEAMAPDLARVLKHQLLDALLADAAALVPGAQSSRSTAIPVDSPPDA